MPKFCTVFLTLGLYIIILLLYNGPVICFMCNRNTGFNCHKIDQNRKFHYTFNLSALKVLCNEKMGGLKESGINR
jgi:hypothetical protein